MAIQQVALGKIIAESSTQPRAAIDHHLAHDYAEAMKDGAQFPPVVGFLDADGDIYLADGFHRLEAHRETGAEKIPCDVKSPNGEAPQRAAILWAVQANEEHGRKRNAEDKRRAVEMLLSDPEWSKWTDSEIARQCRVSQSTVSRHRERLVNAMAIVSPTKRKRRDKHGNVSEIETAKIGRTTKTPGRKETPDHATAASGFEALCRNIAELEIKPEQLAKHIGGEVDRHVVAKAADFLNDFLAVL